MDIYRLFECITGAPIFRKTIITIGTIWSVSHVIKLLGFTYLHFLRRGSIDRYISRDSWALVTGASDGIGRGFAEELLSYGANVVIHGRNQFKLKRVRLELLSSWPERQVEILVIDATGIDGLEDSVRSITNFDIRILVNNVAGGPGPVWSSLANRSSQEVRAWIGATATFPTEITRLLLPKLRQLQPALIVNVGSGACDFSCPFITVYHGAKSYNQSWSRSLSAEMKAEGHDVEVLHLQIGMVQSNSAQREPNFLVPTSRAFTSCALNKVGCRREIVWPYWPHAVQFDLIRCLPEYIRNRAIAGMAVKE